MPEYAAVRGAVAVTARSSLDLLDLPYPFSQLGLLTAAEFAELAGQRRSLAAHMFLPRVDAGVLEELHRCEVLIPLLRVDLKPGPGARKIDVSGSLTARHAHTTVPAELFRGAAEGRVRDPAAEQFTPWPTARSRTLWPSADSGYLYSRHQLLGLHAAMPFIAKLERQVTSGTAGWRLDEQSQPNPPTREALASWRALAIALSALDTRYWPQITRLLYGDLAVWRAALEVPDPAGTADWLGMTPGVIEQQAISLRATASLGDDTGHFYELIRRAKSEAWDSLSGDAAIAMDYRLAADILDRCAEDLNPGTGYAAEPGVPLSQQGLSGRPGTLDAALTRLRLSPFPSLVVAVEGDTEYTIVPRVMDLLGIERNRNRIEVVDFGGVTKDLSLLARYAAAPALGRDYGRGVVLDRPLTRFLVMTDAEKKYKTAGNRRYQRRLLLDSLTVNMPEDLRADYYSNTRRGRIVEIVTWGSLPFEFAHFTDTQLADAMMSAARTPYPGGRERLIHGLTMQRTRNAEPNVEKVFWGGSGLSKLVLADALWPVLVKQIDAAIQRGNEGPPVMRACLRAYEMVSISEHRPVILRRRQSRRQRHPTPG